VVAEGVYHGHHDGVLPPGPGVPTATSDLTTRVPFNAVVELQAAMRETRPAALLLEPLRTNAGLVLPASGYLEAVRGACDGLGAVLIFDEVKTGLTIAAGGATERFGVQPDMVALAKALGAGLPSGAVGMTAALGERVASGAPPLMGTFNGNPLVMAAARASLEHVLTAAAYGRLEELGERMRAGVGEDAVAVGSKGCVERGALDAERSRLIWLWLANRGILTTARREQEWNVTVAHDEAAADAYIETFAELSRRWSGSAPA
jgi:glutamate-1-semialdehyde 2,1-aminomutase